MDLRPHPFRDRSIDIDLLTLFYQPKAHLPCGLILHRISRYYGVKIDYVPGEEERISGKLVLFEDVRTVLDNITVILPVTYTIHDQEIHITKTLK